MKVFSVFGITQSGKTTTVEKIITELRRRRYTVGSVKDIHFEDFAIDTEGTNTDRHKKAGAQLVTARGLFETDILFPSQLPVEKILEFYDHDFVVLEGVSDYNVPKIVCGHTTKELDERINPSVFAISGVISNELTEYQGLPAFNAVEDIDSLVDYIEKKVFPKLPNVAPECCGLCGLSCEKLLYAILSGEKKRGDCLLDSSQVKLTINNQEISMVEFVQEILTKTVVGLVSTLDGYKKYGEIHLEISQKGEEDDTQ
ncbi:molybdopterin-guanine dinucleotide biosynthesis protein B [Candidatus Contubernalis alkaliaceticus]|uniref:molybdopterin-guanine dinucleotide biosynthesis protein B n=1 Tax=Candidatus Contubernalis alkaliaceticus TaxID=338645 RepID=UPI001F4C4286|nr:molybdopterin-guanine dinucleotide biosynthesis protein B [Candidatus Contubernalis alkalaceticus]UNC91952.1 molybdopterin-guanine dinucleotide biosynthesis protein B [Candidatus Contubernalis alkalaceticus]